MKFSVIVADCPWAFSDKLTMSSVKRGAASNYETMTDKDIAGMADQVKAVCKEDCVLALWIPESKLEIGLQVMKVWGFVQKQVFHWFKKTKGSTEEDPKPQIGMGRVFRVCTEVALIGKKGSPEVLDKSVPNVDFQPRTGHSVKPYALHEKLQKMFKGPYLELFGRRAYDGWSVLGNELSGLDIRNELESVLKL